MTDSDYSPGVQEYIHRGQEMNTAAQAERQRMRQMKFDTIAVRGAYGVEAALANQGSINEPLYLSTAQTFENSDHLEAALAYLMPAWTYSRYGNPSVYYLEETLALLESYGMDGEASACATASGMSAIHMVTSPFLVDAPYSKRMNIVAGAKIYGGTFTFFTQRYANDRGVEVRWVSDPLDLDEWASQIDDETRFVYGEMPSNPNLAVFDIAALADLAHAHGIPLIVDPTVATPALMRPLQHGADIVAHSVSKSMATSGFAIAGAFIARRNIPSKVLSDAMRQNFAQQVKQTSFRDYGPGISPFNALMVLNDLRTLRARMDLQSRSALQVARYLEGHPQVEAVWYPGLNGTPGHEIARRYMWLVDGDAESGAPANRYGSLVSFSVRGGLPAARRVYDAFEVVWRATDLGRIKSIATIPAISTHQQQGKAARQMAELPDNLIRLSVGAEHPADLIADLERALG